MGAILLQMWGGQVGVKLIYYET